MKFFGAVCSVMACLMGQVPGQAKADEVFPSSEFTLGIQGQYKYYDEPDVMFEEGFLTGGFASWTGYTPTNHWMLSAEVEATKGKLHYVGQYSDGTLLECNNEDYMIGARGLVGKGYDLDGYALTPFSGLGFRYWNDVIGASGGYEREISQAYIPFGVNVDGISSGAWSYGGSAELDLAVFGTVQSHLRQVNANYQDIYNVQGFAKGIGGRVSVYAEREFDGYTLGLSPYFRYWHFDDSRIDSVSTGRYLEPINYTFLSGVRLYVKF